MLLCHSNGCRPAILVEGVGELTRRGQSAETIDAAREQRSIEAHTGGSQENENGGDYDGGEGGRTRRRPSRQRDVHEHKTDRNVERSAGDEKEFQPKDRKKRQPSQLNADNRAGGVSRVDLTDRRFPSIAVENARDQR